MVKLCKYQRWRKRKIKYSKWEGNHENHQVQLLALHRSAQKSHDTADSIVQPLPELWQARCHDCFPWEAVLMPSHTLSEEPFHDIQTVFLSCAA